MKANILVNILFISLLFVMSACGGGSSTSVTNPPVIAERGALISSDLVSTDRSILLPYTVNSHKLVYYTVDTNNNIIKASGLLSVPSKGASEKSPIISYQHGTIFLDSQAPSIHASTLEGIATLAGTGYIVSAPDFIGYGESSALIHPYMHAESLASASIDMLRASKSFLFNNNIQVNEQLFLTGYSEGGYATLALQKAIQEGFSSEFTVTASAPGAGPFDLSETAKTLANKITNDDPSYMSFVIKAYDSTYALGKIDEIYQLPYRTIVNTYFDGNHSGSEIDTALSHTTSELFEAPFLSALQGTGSHILKDKLALNNIYDWKPNAPTRFYHGPNDEIVPYSNAITTLETMQANGATNVSLGICPLNTHVQCAVPFVLDALNFFSDYSQDL